MFNEMSETIIERADVLKKVMNEAIAESEKQGGMRAVFRSSVELKKNTTVEATARQFHFNMDEPSDDGGEDNGPTPEEVILREHAHHLAHRLAHRIVRVISWDLPLITCDHRCAAIPCLC